MGIVSAAFGMEQNSIGSDDMQSDPEFTALITASNANSCSPANTEKNKQSSHLISPQRAALKTQQGQLLAECAQVRSEFFPVDNGKNKKLNKEIPTSVVIYTGGFFSIFFATCGYLCYRAGKHIHTQMKQQKDTVTFRVSANVVPSIARS